MKIGNVISGVILCAYGKFVFLLWHGHFLRLRIVSSGPD